MITFYTKEGILYYKDEKGNNKIFPESITSLSEDINLRKENNLTIPLKSINANLESIEVGLLSLPNLEKVEGNIKLRRINNASFPSLSYVNKLYLAKTKIYDFNNLQSANEIIEEECNTLNFPSLKKVSVIYSKDCTEINTPASGLVLCSTKCTCNCPNSKIEKRDDLAHIRDDVYIILKSWEEGDSYIIECKNYFNEKIKAYSICYKNSINVDGETLEEAYKNLEEILQNQI